LPKENEPKEKAASHLIRLRRISLPCNKITGRCETRPPLGGLKQSEPQHFMLRLPSRFSGYFFAAWLREMAKQSYY